MKKIISNLGITVALVTIIFVVAYIVTLFTPTPPPTQRSLDYLKVVTSVANIQSRVEAQKENASGVLSELNDNERQKVREISNGLITQINLRNDGAIDIHAVIASTEKEKIAQGVSVNVLLVPEKFGEKYDWHCFGSPISALPKFCNKLP